MRQVTKHANKKPGYKRNEVAPEPRHAEPPYGAKNHEQKLEERARLQGEHLERVHDLTAAPVMGVDYHTGGKPTRLNARHMAENANREPSKVITAEDMRNPKVHAKVHAASTQAGQYGGVIGSQLGTNPKVKAR